METNDLQTNEKLCRFQYVVTTQPDPLEVSPEKGSPKFGQIDIAVGTEQPIYCQKIQFRLKNGNTGNEATNHIENVKTSVSGEDWTFQAVGQGIFLAKPKRSGQPIRLEKGLSFSLASIEMNQQVGVFTLYIDEFSSADGTSFEQLSEEVPLAKKAPKFYLDNFVAEPDILFYGEKTKLTWEGSDDAVYTVRWPDQERTVQGHVLEVYDLKKNTTFTLTAELHGKKKTMQTTVTVQKPKFNDFQADRKDVDYGENVTLSWAPNDRLQQLVLVGDEEELPLEQGVAQISVQPRKSLSTYWLRGFYQDKWFESPKAIVRVRPAKVISFQASPGTIPPGSRCVCNGRWSRPSVESIR